MDFLKNLPQNPAALAGLIDIRPGRVVSMSLSRSEAVQMMLMAVADGEAVTSEQYPGDMLYYVLEGEMPFLRDGAVTLMHAGDCVAVPAGAPHAIGGGGAFKLLQITVTV